MSKNNFFAVLLAAAAVVGSIGCKKENENSLVNQHKAIGSELGGNQLKELEFYTPNESTLRDKLLAFNNYMNEPEAYPMPNMEIKEAVWFMETFFNFGLVYKQERGIKEITSEDTDFIDVSFEGTEDGGIILNGKELQLKYGELLKKVKARLSPQYIINLGDVYVESIDWNQKKATVGVRKKLGKIADPEPVCYATIGMLKIIPPDFPTPTYPGDYNDATFFYNLNDFYDYNNKPTKTFTDPSMRKTLNQKHLSPFVYPINVIEVKEYLKTYISTPNIYKANITTTLGWSVIYDDCTNYGWRYRDTLWGGIWPRIASQYPGYEPLYAGCILKVQERNISPTITEKWALHDYCIEAVCEFIPKTMWDVLGYGNLAYKVGTPSIVTTY